MHGNDDGTVPATFGIIYVVSLKRRLPRHLYLFLQFQSSLTFSLPPSFSFLCSVPPSFPDWLETSSNSAQAFGEGEWETLSERHPWF